MKIHLNLDDSVSRSEIGFISWSLIIAIIPWMDNYEERISQLVDNNDILISKLFRIYTKQFNLIQY